MGTPVTAPTEGRWDGCCESSCWPSSARTARVPGWRCTSKSSGFASIPSTSGRDGSGGLRSVRNATARMLPREIHSPGSSRWMDDTIRATPPRTTTTEVGESARLACSSSDRGTVLWPAPLATTGPAAQGWPAGSGLGSRSHQPWPVASRRQPGRHSASTRRFASTSPRSAGSIHQPVTECRPRNAMRCGRVMAPTGGAPSQLEGPRTRADRQRPTRTRSSAAGTPMR
jgi:hypothetical protein